MHTRMHEEVLRIYTQWCIRLDNTCLRRALQAFANVLFKTFVKKIWARRGIQKSPSEMGIKLINDAKKQIDTVSC